jgi:hypothetical protein
MQQVDVLEMGKEMNIIIIYRPAYIPCMYGGSRGEQPYT